MAGKTPRPQATQERILTPLLTPCPECGCRRWGAYTNDRLVATLEGVLQLNHPRQSRGLIWVSASKAPIKP